MTVKFNRTGNRTYLSFGSAAASSLPDADWAIGFTIFFDGALETDGAVQTVLRTTEASVSGGIQIGWDPTNSGRAQAGKVYVTVDGISTARCIAPQAIQAGQAFQFVVQKAGAGITTKMCPILPFEPSDGASVLSSPTYNLGKALNNAGPVIVGDRELNNRRFDHSMGRVFRVERALTDLEIARLAYGREINSILTPTWYLPLPDATNLTDQGSQANPVTVTGSFAKGGEPAYGFSSTPTAPSFTSQPTIIGAPRTGFPSSYQPGTVQGNPSPTTTQQWQLSTNGTTWANISGATAATYTPVVGDVGKQLRVRQIATNTQASTSADSVGVLINSEDVGLALNEPTAERIYQRIAGFAQVPIGGTFTGAAPASIEYQLYAPDGTTVIKPWATAGATFGAGTWTASPSMPAPSNGQKYRIAVRSKNSSAAIIATTAVSSNQFGVGDIILVIGSSSATAWFNNGSGANLIPDNASTSLLNEGHTAERYWSLFGTNGRASQMAAYIAQSTGVPIAMAPLSLGGSKLAEWADTASLGGRIVATIANVGGKVGGMFSTAGSNDITSANGAPSVQSHLDTMLTVASIARNSGNQPELPILWSGINRRTNAFDGPANNARAAENIFGGTAYANNYHVQTLDFELSSDGTHLTGAGYIACCDRIQYVWSEGRKGIKMRGPEINRIAVNGANVVVTVTQYGANDLTPATNGTGFTAYDASGNPLTVSNSRRLSGNQIGLMCSGTPARVCYLEGQGPAVGTPYYNDAARPLPMLAAVYTPVVQGNDPVPVPVFRDFNRTWQILSSGGTPTPQPSPVFRDFPRVWAILGATPEPEPEPDPEAPDERNYAWIQAQVRDWLHRKDLSAQIPQFITMAESRINRIVHARGMEVEATLPFAVGIGAVRLPVGFGTPLAAWIIDGTCRRDLVGTVPEQLPGTTEQGEPQFWAISGTYLALDRPVDRARNVVIRYRGLLRLSDAAPNNSVLTKYPDVYLYGALLSSATFIRDQESLAIWSPLFDAAMRELNRNESRARAIAPLRTEVAALLGGRRGNFYTE